MRLSPLRALCSAVVTLYRAEAATVVKWKSVVEYVVRITWWEYHCWTLFVLRDESITAESCSYHVMRVFVMRGYVEYMWWEYHVMRVLCDESIMWWEYYVMRVFVMRGYVMRVLRDESICDERLRRVLVDIDSIVSVRCYGCRDCRLSAAVMILIDY
jgi:hypothetical protein